MSGSSYLFDQQIARFLATLPPFPTEDASGGPEDEAGMVVDDVQPDEAPPAGVVATGQGTAAGGKA